jgi:hypothetical protein
MLRRYLCVVCCYCVVDDVYICYLRRHCVDSTVLLLTRLHLLLFRLIYCPLQFVVVGIRDLLFCCGYCYVVTVTVFALL